MRKERKFKRFLSVMVVQSLGVSIYSAEKFTVPVFKIPHAKVPAKMLHLQSAQMLLRLEKCLRKSLPESLKVYGTIFHMNQGNPFKLKALVDKWPDFNTVVIRPQEQEMTDDFDHHTNTYQIYSKDLKNCHEALSTSDVINWKQHLQIQSSQPSLDEVIQNLATTKFIKVKQTQRILYITPEMAIKLLPSLPETKNLPPGYSRPKASNQECFKSHPWMLPTLPW
uniref:Glycine N-acyltransferase-like protein n=1 Tax=Sus scrofa TaxID=9823 RepID=A0A287A7E5_PIG